MKWATGILTDLGTVARGRSRHRPRNDPELYGGEFPFFQTGDVKAAELWLRVYSDTYNHAGLAQSRLWPAGTLAITIAANIAESAILGVPGCFPDSVVGFTPTPERSDVVFVKYLLDYVRYRFQSISRGTTQDNLSVEKLLSVEMQYPPLSTQRKIAAILSAYDDLIENNALRIKVLEEMAQRIYREWSVDFRYPGHENVPLADSTLGSIPAGWDWGSASDVLSINPRVAIDGSAPHKFVPMTSVSESGMHLSPITERVGASGARFINGDTLFARITPCLENGKTAFVQCLPEKTAATGSTEFIVLRSKRLCPEMVYLLARSEDFRSHAIKSMSGATGRQRVREECFASFMVPTPPQEVISAFSGLVRPLFSLSYSLHLATQLLRSARDLLLPRLISGTIDVESLDIEVPEGAA
jgi:type I restriction enzyme S subunit